MIPVTYPSSVSPSSNESQMVVFALSSVTGLQRWTDYIPIKLEFHGAGVPNSFNQYGFIPCDFLESTTGKQAWVDYVPVYVDNSATTAWEVSDVGYIPYSLIPVTEAYLLQEDGSYLLQEDGFKIFVISTLLLQEDLSSLLQEDGSKIYA